MEAQSKVSDSFRVEVQDYENMRIPTELYQYGAYGIKNPSAPW
jgi:hypothetical protein